MTPPPPAPPPADEAGVPPVSSPAVSVAAPTSEPVPVPPVGGEGKAGLAPTLIPIPVEPVGATPASPVPAPVPAAPVPVPPVGVGEGEAGLARTITVEPEAPALPPINVELDPSLLLFILSPRYKASIDAVKKNFNLNDDDVIFICDLDRLVMAGDMDLEAYLLALDDELTALSEEQRNQLFAELLAERFVPLGDLLKPTAVEVARAEDIKLPSTQHYQIYSKPLTYSGAATEVAASAGVSLMGGPVRERMRELIVSKLKGVRTSAQVREVMTRGIDFGGLGLDQKSAEQALAAMDDILHRAKVLSEDEYANWLSAETRRKSEPAVVTSAPTSLEDEEITKMRASMPRQSDAAATALDRATETTLSRITYRPDNDYLAKRLNNVVSSRLRDVRSPLEVKQLLMRDTKVGGMGLDSAAADQVVKQIEVSYQEFHEPIATEEKRKNDLQLGEHERKVEERKKQEAEEHARWFEEKIRTRKAGETRDARVAEEMKRSLVPVVEQKEQRAETVKYGPMVPATSLASDVASRPTPSPIAQVAKEGIKVSQATVQLAQAAPVARPSMDAVKFSPQLVGLVGELKALTLTEFRRLSKNPNESAKKILSKFETLGQESFEKRVDGIKAFKASPLQGSYVALVGESFRAAKPVAALAEEKRAAGQDVPSPDEIAAIVAINSALHF